MQIGAAKYRMETAYPPAFWVKKYREPRATHPLSVTSPLEVNRQVRVRHFVPVIMTIEVHRETRRHRREATIIAAVDSRRRMELPSEKLLIKHA